MRLLPAGIAAILMLPNASAIRCRVNHDAGAPRPVTAQLGRSSGSVSDSLDRQGSDILAKESKFNNSTGRNPTKRVRGNVASFNLEFWASVSL